MQKSYLLKKKAINTPKLKDYFDDDSDEDCGPSSAPSTAPLDDDYDPLDAFMAKNEQQIAKDESVSITAESLPEIVSEQDRDYEADVSDTVRLAQDVNIADINMINDGAGTKK